MRARTALLVYAGASAASAGLRAAGAAESVFWLIPLATIFVGAVTRRWWAVLLPAWIPPAAALAWAIDPDPGDSDAVDSSGSAALFVLIYFAVPLAILTAISVAVGKVVLLARRRRLSVP